MIAGVAPYLFLAGFLLAISFGVHILTAHVDPACTLPPRPPEQAACKICAEASADGKTVKLTASTSDSAPSNQFLANMQADYWNQMNAQTLWALSPDNCTWFVSVLANLFGICGGRLPAVRLARGYQRILAASLLQESPCARVSRSDHFLSVPQSVHWLRRSRRYQAGASSGSSEISVPW